LTSAGARRSVGAHGAAAASGLSAGTRDLAARNVRRGGRSRRCAGDLRGHTSRNAALDRLHRRKAAGAARAPMVALDRATHRPRSTVGRSSFCLGPRAHPPSHRGQSEGPRRHAFASDRALGDRRRCPLLDTGPIATSRPLRQGDGCHVARDSRRACRRCRHRSGRTGCLFSRRRGTRRSRTRVIPRPPL
jgi:hypothetical protein